MNIIRDTRTKKRITQKQLAEMIGVSQAYISKIESDEFINVTVIEIIKLAKALENLHLKLKIIERNEERCNYLSQELDNALIINGDGTDGELLKEEGIVNINLGEKQHNESCNVLT